VKTTNYDAFIINFHHPPSSSFLSRNSSSALVLQTTALSIPGANWRRYWILFNTDCDASCK